MNKIVVRSFISINTILINQLYEFYLIGKSKMFSILFTILNFIQIFRFFFDFTINN
jgi:hypothetical protein